MQSRRSAAALGRWWVACLLALLVSVGVCVEPAPRAAPRQRSRPAPARLVVALVFDQLGSDTLLRHQRWLDPSGAIAQAIAQGVFLERSVYPYASTLTAPGHAAIHTGTAPSQNGIDNNSRWDEAQGRALGIVDEPRRWVFGRERDGITVGPGQLRLPTVATQLKAETGGAARVVSLSLKDRSAVLSVGGAADLVLWFDSKLGAFTSSSAWGAALPEWVGRYQAAHPLQALFVPWEPLFKERYEAQLGPDAAPGEGDLYGLGTTFPHDWARVKKPWSALGCTPMLSEYLIELADAAVTEQGLGLDAVPDLLALSISGTDCAGHVFGPDSWEYVDHLVRADRAAGQWLTRLAKRLPLSVLITSDHGVARLPESAPAPNGRIASQPIVRHVEA
ncbi:MAG TPA: alkaline phosphatase family protein, partial [Polyangiaceae bacterium]|nr:alkaline phosphatase family protein [Polyangiaceae bacterium]